MYRFYAAPAGLADALALKAEHGEGARILAGGTDLLIELDRGVRAAPGGGELGLIDLTRIPGLAEIQEADGQIHLGPLVTHNQCVAHPAIVARAFPLARACWEVGAPQIRNRATVAGNLITASPANDTIVPLLALGATVTLTSAARGERTLPLAAFYTGFRKVDLAPDEILTRISFAALDDAQGGAFIKLGLRRAQAISVLSVAAIVRRDAAGGVTQAAISLGAVAPAVIRAQAAEQFLVGKRLDESVIGEAARLAQAAASPIDDIRATAAYRRAMVETLTARALGQIRDGQTRSGWPAAPVMLWGRAQGRVPVGTFTADSPARVNGAPVTPAGGMTLLDSLRQAGYVGVKEGCAEGECGACTVFLDGMAVMACLVPAERAAGCEVVTVEGLGDPAALHPVQGALVQSGGVQCGYCTPGFVMSAAKLLEERPHPTRREAQEAITGNFCRCTGYRKILDAMVQAGRASPARLPAQLPGP
ncbi:MAG: FAD binding domain-containing protein [Caldilineaceae bacterium]|nr:FAD binding domain-containing protein [Caldilineaceae bacterium]